MMNYKRCSLAVFLGLFGALVAVWFHFSQLMVIPVVMRFENTVHTIGMLSVKGERVGRQLSDFVTTPEYLSAYRSLSSHVYELGETGDLESIKKTTLGKPFFLEGSDTFIIEDIVAGQKMWVDTYVHSIVEGVDGVLVLFAHRLKGNGKFNVVRQVYFKKVEAEGWVLSAEVSQDDDLYLVSKYLSVWAIKNRRDIYIRALPSGTSWFSYYFLGETLELSDKTEMLYFPVDSFDEGNLFYEKSVDELVELGLVQGESAQRLDDLDREVYGPFFSSSLLPRSVTRGLRSLNGDVYIMCPLVGELTSKPSYFYLVDSRYQVGNLLIHGYENVLYENDFFRKTFCS